MKSAQRQFLWTCDVPGLSEMGGKSKSGGEVTSDATKVWDGGDLTPHVIASPPEVGDVTIVYNYDAERHQELLTSLVKKVGQLQTTISGQPLTGDMRAVRGAAPRVYPNALLIGVREPESDSSSGDAADFELTWAVGQVG
jgi:hypothetical protein